MVERDYFRKAAEYKFEFCKNCPFYECELINEYTHFKDAHTHAQEYECQLQVMVDGREVVCQPENSPSEEILSYDNSVVEDRCIMSCRHVYQIECGRKRVTEGIGDHFKIQLDYEGRIEENKKDRWEPLQPVFISAQTGQGKNYFIEHTLIPYVRDLNYKNETNRKILILSNRLALRQQIKGRIGGNDGLDSEEDEVYYYDKYVDVMTYQSLLHKEWKTKI